MFFISENYNNKKIQLNKIEVTYNVLIPELIKRRDITLGICTDLNSKTPHNCHHNTCKYHSAEYCRKWTAIPKFIEDCSFPSWFKSEFYYDIDPVTRELARIDENILQEAKKEYDRLYSKFNHVEQFQYVFNELRNAIILIVPKEIIKEKDTQFIYRFFEYYTKRHKKYLQDLFGYVILDFPDYANDPTVIFQIDEIIEYFKLLKAETPFVLVFINDLSCILPIFIKYEIRFEGTKYFLKFDIESQKSFFISEVKELTTFLSQAKIKDDGIVNSYIHKLENSFAL
jgi:hypothetical protein